MAIFINSSKEMKPRSGDTSFDEFMKIAGFIEVAMKIILFQPQIPQNTGNIVRTCSVTGSSLGLVRPLGFSINNRWLKRAGLDYWEGVDIEMIDDLESYLESTTSDFYFFSSKARKCYADISYKKEDLLIFGSETDGLAPLFANKWPERFVNIPMISGARCLNLATSAGIVVYEAWRQLGFLKNLST